MEEKNFLEKELLLMGLIPLGLEFSVKEAITKNHPIFKEEEAIDSFFTARAYAWICCQLNLMFGECEDENNEEERRYWQMNVNDAKSDFISSFYNYGRLLIKTKSIDKIKDLMQYLGLYTSSNKVTMNRFKDLIRSKNRTLSLPLLEKAKWFYTQREQMKETICKNLRNSNIIDDTKEGILENIDEWIMSIEISGFQIGMDRFIKNSGLSEEEFLNSLKEEIENQGFKDF